MVCPFSDEPKTGRATGVALGGLTLPLAGCTNNAAEDDENEENDTADGNGNGTVNEEEEETPDGPEEQKLSGTGPEASNDVSIQGGLIVVDATHEGEDDFEVRLIPENSDAGKVFADSSGTYAGQTARHIGEGTYQLSVVADGGWEVTIKQPRPTSGESPPLPSTALEMKSTVPLSSRAPTSPPATTMGSALVSMSSRRLVTPARLCFTKTASTIHLRLIMRTSAI